MTEFHPPAAIDFYFNPLLDLTQSHGVPVYFVSMPISRDSFAALKPAFVAGYTAYIANLSARQPYFHPIGALIPTMPSPLFSDPSHLGTEGALLWSRELRKRWSMQVWTPGLSMSIGSRKRSSLP